MDENPLELALLKTLEEHNSAITDPEDLLEFIAFMYKTSLASLAMSVKINSQIKDKSMTIDEVEDMYDIYKDLLNSVNPITVIKEHNEKFNNQRRH